MNTGLDLSTLLKLLGKKEGSLAGVPSVDNTPTQLAMSMLQAGKPQTVEAKPLNFGGGMSADAQQFLQQYGLQAQLAAQKQQEEMNKQKLQGLLQMIGGMK